MSEKTESIAVQIGKRIAKIEVIKLIVPHDSIGEPKYVSISSNGFNIPKYYIDNHFSNGYMNAYLDEKNRILIFEPSTRNFASYTVKAGLRSMVKKLHLEIGGYKAVWLEERGLLLVDLDQRVIYPS